MLDISSTPHFLPPYRPPTGGVDFLGLRTVNLDMMAVCLPGFNNVTSHVRPYSVVAWIFWKLFELAEERGRATTGSVDMMRFRDKVENLFIWGHQLHGVRGIPGIASSPPAAAGDGKVPLGFKDWKRTYSSTGLMAAINYGPSSKFPDGLGFLQPIQREFFSAMGRGVELAKALDKELRQCPDYGVLDNLDVKSAAEDVAKSLFEHWSINVVTSAEKGAFRNAFYEPMAIGDGTALGRRSATLSLIHSLLGSSDNPLVPSAIREQLALTRPPAGASLGNRQAWLSWFILQVRQAQRIGLEAILAWLEIQLIFHGQRNVERIIDVAVHGLSYHTDKFPGATVKDALASLREAIGGLDQLLSVSASDPNLSFLSHMEAVAIAIKNGEGEQLLPLALRTLLMSVLATEALEAEEKGDSISELDWGGPDRISLRYWRATVEKLGGKSLKEFLRHVLEVLIISQHCSIAASRFDGRTHRLRLTLDEEGLVPLVAKPWKPVISPDRLETALLLMKDCGLVAGDSSAGYVLQE